MQNMRTGVYIDLSNINQCGGFLLKFDVLRDFINKTSDDSLALLNIYLALDVERCKTDTAYEKSSHDFHELLRDMGYRVIEKKVKWYQHEGISVPKSNADLEMAVDILLNADKLHRVVLVTGDGDFVKVVDALHQKGVRVELIGFKNVSTLLRRSVDRFYSGYIIPGMLPVDFSGGKSIATKDRSWGEVGSRVRGTCYYYSPERSYGFFRVLNMRKAKSTNMNYLDPRHPLSPYDAVFFHGSDVEHIGTLKELPNRDIVMEFDILRDGPNKVKAKNFSLTYGYISL